MYVGVLSAPISIPIYLCLPGENLYFVLESVRLVGYMTMKVILVQHSVQG